MIARKMVSQSVADHRPDTKDAGIDLRMDSQSLRDELKANGIDVKEIFWGIPDHQTPFMRKTTVLCNAPWEQYNRNVRPGTYLGTFDGDVSAFVNAYRLRYST